MNPTDLANWKCRCGKGPSIAHQVNAYCPYEDGYAAAIEDAANEVRSYMHENGLPVTLLDLANRIKALLSRGSR